MKPDQLTQLLADLRHEIARHNAPASVERELLVAFARRTTERPSAKLLHKFREGWLAWPLALAATIAMLSWMIRQPGLEFNQPQGSGVAPVAQAESGTPFFPLVSLQQIAAHERNSTIVPAEMPRTTLADFGLPINPERAAEPVRTELLIGHDGVVMAIRFLN